MSLRPTPKIGVSTPPAGSARPLPARNYTRELLRNPLAQIYFASGRDTFINFKRFFDNLPEVYKQRAAELDKQDILSLARKTILDYLIYRKEQGIQDIPEHLLNENNPLLIEDFFQSKANGNYDLGQFGDAKIMAAEAYLQIGNSAKALKWFDQLYTVLQAGYLRSKEHPSANIPRTATQYETALKWAEASRDEALKESLEKLFRGPYTEDTIAAIKSAITSVAEIRDIDEAVENLRAEFKEEPQISGIHDRHEFAHRGLGKVQSMLMALTSGVFTPSPGYVNKYLPITLTFLRYLDSKRS